MSAPFLLVGVLGFVPGITANFDQLHLAGHHSEAMLLGLFQVSALHNIVHLLFGAAGIALARTAGGARSFLLYGGVIYLVLFVYGLVIPQDSAGNFVPLNGFDNVLHLLLGVGMVALALILAKGHAKGTRLRPSISVNTTHEMAPATASAAADAIGVPSLAPDATGASQSPPAVRPWRSCPRASR